MMTINVCIPGLMLCGYLNDNCRTAKLLCDGSGLRSSTIGDYYYVNINKCLLVCLIFSI